MKKFFFGLLSGLLIAFTVTSGVNAEEVVAEEPASAEVVAEEPAAQESTPTPEPAYTPPPEALEGVGGWAVVDPVTGNVHGVVVCTNDVCGPSGSWGGKMPVDYMGCSGCDLRFQTRATADGNVAGWHGTQTHIDEDGNASQSNDGSVRWNASDNTFTLENQSVTQNGDTVKRKQKLVPEKTATDGVNLHTGIKDVETSFESSSEGESVEVNVKQDNLFTDEARVSVEVESWRLFNYGNIQDARDQVEADIENVLAEDGFVSVVEEEITDEDGVTSLQEREEISEPVFVKAVRDLSKKVVEFFNGWFSFGS